MKTLLARMRDYATMYLRLLKICIGIGSVSIKTTQVVYTKLIGLFAKTYTRKSILKTHYKSSHTLGDLAAVDLFGQPRLSQCTGTHLHSTETIYDTCRPLPLTGAVSSFLLPIDSVTVTLLTNTWSLLRDVGLYNFPSPVYAAGLLVSNMSSVFNNQTDK